MKDTLLNFITKRPNDALIIDFWRTGQAGKIIDHKGDCIFRFVDYINDDGVLRIKHLTEESEHKCPVVACGLVGYWLHKRDDEGTKAIFDGYFQRCLRGYEKAHKNDDDAWKRDLTKEFVCQYHIQAEMKSMKISEALFPYITESDQEKVKSIMVNYLEYANSKRIELYPEEGRQNVSSTASRQSKPGSVNENVAELLTAEAQVLWRRLRDAGFIVVDGYALAEGVSANQAAYIADRMAEKLRIKKKWKLFQQLWGIPNLGQLAGTWQQTGKLPPRYSDIDNLMK